MTSKGRVEGKVPLFRSAADTIRYNIQKGRLGADVVLLEGPIAELLSISRAPVKRALALLEEEGIIRRFDGRGYLVGPHKGARAPSAPIFATLTSSSSTPIPSPTIVPTGNASTGR